MNFPVKELKNWFSISSRDLPWRTERTPYRVWISEVMLQQTQSVVVIPYLERWMEAFPTIEALSNAPLEQVIKVWEGLGYYSRARNLHAAAKYIHEHLGSHLPSDPQELRKIKGIGPYTAGAILSFAFHKKAAAVDGNTIRVLSRFYGIKEPVDKPATVKKLWQLAETLLPEEEPWIVTEALIELGALVCKKVPDCKSCPLASDCLAFRHGLTAKIPHKEGKIKTTFLFRHVAIIMHQGKYLVTKGAANKVMSDLYEFPYFEAENASEISQESLLTQFRKVTQLNLVYHSSLPSESHSFTRYSAHLMPHSLEAKAATSGLWKTPEQLKELPFSSGHRRILHKVLA